MHIICDWPHYTGVPDEGRTGGGGLRRGSKTNEMPLCRMRCSGWAVDLPAILEGVDVCFMSRGNQKQGI